MNKREIPRHKEVSKANGPYRDCPSEFWQYLIDSKSDVREIIKGKPHTILNCIQANEAPSLQKCCLLIKVRHTCFRIYNIDCYISSQ